MSRKIFREECKNLCFNKVCSIAQNRNLNLFNENRAQYKGKCATLMHIQGEKMKTARIPGMT